MNCISSGAFWSGARHLCIRRGEPVGGWQAINEVQKLVDKLLGSLEKCRMPRPKLRHACVPHPFHRWVDIREPIDPILGCPCDPNGSTQRAGALARRRDLFNAELGCNTS
jgi:hypothetical protein